MLKEWLKIHWRETLGIVLLLFAFFFTHRFFFLPGDFRTHDGVHFIRLYDLDKVLREGQFPPRWLSDMGKGYGYPFFNFYPPFAYFVGEIFHFLGFSFTVANKLSFALAGASGILGMFIFIKYLFSAEIGVLVSFLWAFLPYRAVDLYVRGSLAEYWGMNWLPWIFYFLVKFLKGREKRDLIKFILVLTILLLTHNVVSLLTVLWLGGLLLFYFIFGERKDRDKKLLLLILLAFVLSLGLAAFFIFPALSEKKFTSINTMTSGYYAFYNHFPSFYQLFFSRFWGYGGSNFGAQNDKMSFQIGYLHWILPFVSLFVLSWQFLVKKKRNREILLGVFFVFSFWLFAFLSHQRSVFIWEIIVPLQLLQFSWRFLIFIGFSGAIATAFVFYQLNKLSVKVRYGLYFLLIVLTVALNYSYFQPRAVDLISDKDYLSGDLWQYLQREFMTDYLPVDVQEIPEEYYHSPLILSEEKVEMLIDQADKISFKVNAKGNNKEALVKRFYFPGWQAEVNGKPKEILTNKNGFIVIKLYEGENGVDVSLKNTPLRRWSNIISLISLGILGFLILC